MSGGNGDGGPRDEDLALAKEAAVRAGMVLMSHFQKRIAGDRTVEHKGTVDLVTDADRAAEHTVLEILRVRRPDDAVIAEEKDAAGLGAAIAGRRWIVDPLDGTTNFAHAVPHFAVSIALWDGDRPLVGVVYAPAAGELFEAAAGRGAALATFRRAGLVRGEPIRVSTVAPLREALCATGFPYDRHEADDDNTREHRAFLKACQGVRRMGAAALDLAWVAAGRYDGYWEMKLKPWDVAAGALIVREAGGRVTGYDGGALAPDMAKVVASNGLVHDEMVALLASPSALR